MNTQTTTNPVNASSIIDYELIDGKMTLNKAGLRARKIVKEAKDYKCRLQFVRAGAAVLNLFIQNPWLQSFSLVLEPYVKSTVRYSMPNEPKPKAMFNAIKTEGVDAAFGNVVQIPGTTLPSAFGVSYLSHTGELNVHLVKGLLEQLKNANGDTAILNALKDNCKSQSFCIDADRSKVDYMFESGNFSGIDAFKLYLMEQTSFTMSYISTKGATLAESSI